MRGNRTPNREDAERYLPTRPGVRRRRPDRPTDVTATSAPRMPLPPPPPWPPRRERAATSSAAPPGYSRHSSPATPPVPQQQQQQHRLRAPCAHGKPLLFVRSSRLLASVRACVRVCVAATSSALLSTVRPWCACVCVSLAARTTPQSPFAPGGSASPFSRSVFPPRHRGTVSILRIVSYVIIIIIIMLEGR